MRKNLLILILISFTTAVGAVSSLMGKDLWLNDGSDANYTQFTEPRLKSINPIADVSPLKTSDTLVKSATGWVARPYGGGQSSPLLGSDNTWTGSQYWIGDQYRMRFFNYYGKLDFGSTEYGYGNANFYQGATVNKIKSDGTINAVGGFEINGVPFIGGLMSKFGGYDNFFAGVNAGNLTMSDTATSNTGVGVKVLCSITTGTKNTAVGAYALQRNTYGIFNNAFGQNALRENTTGIENTALSENALTHNTTGSDNVAVGGGALHQNNGDGNVAIGVSALLGLEYDNQYYWHPNDIISTGDHNTAMGTSAGLKNSSGSNNTILGASALWKNEAGNGDVAIGYYAGAYEMGSDKFYLNNRDRVTSEGDRLKSLLYGGFADDPAAQFLTVNGNFKVIGKTITPYANVITVAKSGGDYDTITSAVAAASTGTTILVYPGTYNEQVSLNIPANLVGIDKNLSKITYNTTGDYTHSVVNVTADNCLIENLSIENLYDSGTLGATALTVRKQNFRATNCNIESGGRDTIWIVGTDASDGNLIIEYCYIRGDYDVISVVRSFTLRYSIIKMNAASDNGYIWADASATWYHNVIVTSFMNVGKNGGSGAKRILASSSGGYTVSLNEIGYYCEGTGGAVGGTCTLSDASYAGSLNFLGDVVVSGDVTGTSVSGNLIGGYSSVSAGGAQPSFFSEHSSGGDYSYIRFIYPGIEFSVDGLTWDTNLYRPDESPNVLKTDDAFDANSFKVGGTERIDSSGIMNPLSLKVNGTEVISSARVANPVSLKIGGTERISSAGIGKFASLDINSVERIDSSGNLVLATTLSTSGTAQGRDEVSTAGENLIFGNVCYYKSDGKLWKADATTSTTTNNYLWMAMSAITANTTGKFMRSGTARSDSWSWTVGGTLYLSTAGTMTQTAPSSTNNIIKILGVCRPNSNTVYFEPSADDAVHN